MWGRRNLPIFFALCISILLHGAAFYEAPRFKARVRFSRLPSPRQEEVRLSLSLLDPEPAATPAKPDKPKALEKLPAVKPPEPAPVPKVEKKEKPKPQVKFPDEMGDATGKGVGSNKSEGADLLHAREAEEDQAFLSRDPIGPGRRGNKPSNWLVSPGENGRGGSPGAAAAAAPARTPRETVPNPADRASVEPLAVRTPSPNPAEPAAPAKMIEVPVPPARAQKPQDATASNTPAVSHVEPARRLSALRPTLLAFATPVETDRPAAPPMIQDPPILSPRTSDVARVGGDRSIENTGEAGIDSEKFLMPDEKVSPASIRKPTTHPGKEPGRDDGPIAAVKVAIPQVAPGQPADARAVPPRPAFALFLAPPQPAPTPPPDVPAVDDPLKTSQDMPKPVDRAPAPPVKPAPAPAANVPQSPASPVPATPPAPPSPAPIAAAQATGDGRLPGAPRPAADPAQMSDSESDAFSKIGSAVFHDGRLDPRFGRKVKTVLPHIPIVGMWDSVALRNPSVTFEVNIDPTGKVSEVRVHKSSGSNEIDQPCLLAMYDWWFEPLTDSNGKPRSDTILFTIIFR